MLHRPPCQLQPQIVGGRDGQLVNGATEIQLSKGCNAEQHFHAGAGLAGRDIAVATPCSVSAPTIAGANDHDEGDSAASMHH